MAPPIKRSQVGVTSLCLWEGHCLCSGKMEVRLRLSNFGALTMLRALDNERAMLQVLRSAIIITDASK